MASPQAPASAPLGCAEDKGTHFPGSRFPEASILLCSLRFPVMGSLAFSPHLHETRFPKAEIWSFSCNLCPLHPHSRVNVWPFTPPDCLLAPASQMQDPRAQTLRSTVTLPQVSPCGSPKPAWGALTIPTLKLPQPPPSQATPHRYQSRRETACLPREQLQYEPVSSSALREAHQAVLDFSHVPTTTSNLSFQHPCASVSSSVKQ